MSILAPSLYFRIGVACAAAWGLAACSLSSAARPGRAALPPEGRPAALRLPPEELHTQRLFRVHYAGPEGDGSMRMTLRLEEADRFWLTSSDTLGRALWSLQAEPDGLLLLLHRERTFCRSGADLSLPETALAPLPVGTLPSVLLGYLPVPPEGLEDGLPDEVDYKDDSGRRWTARSEIGAPSAWTLWNGNGPSLWWSRQPRGGVLSHRDGIQFRWREVVREPLANSVAQLVIPDDYVLEPCPEAEGSDSGADLFDSPFGDL